MQHGGNRCLSSSELYSADERDLRGIERRWLLRLVIDELDPRLRTSR